MTIASKLAPGPYLKAPPADRPQDGLTIDGKAVADQIRKEVSAGVARIQDKHGKVRRLCEWVLPPCAVPRCFAALLLCVCVWCASRLPCIDKEDRRPSTYDHTHASQNLPQVPGLAVVIVGERKDSQTYVRMKRKACAEVGFRSFNCDMPADATQQEVLAAVARFNADPNVHGILVQLPVSRRLDSVGR
jgi:5,10-methylene-tetrahydrofolate dehydrogenase/methenyl tetrahydrofolate cyclohydrolase